MVIHTGPEIRDLAQEADRFQAVLQAARDKVDPEDWTWYRYDSLGLFSILDQMLTGSRRYLLDLIGNRTVLDIGCGDGALALFFESLGYSVTAVDNSATNCNRMQGVRALRQALGSNIDIVDLDVDSAPLSPPAEPHGIALALGILYHLRNPFHLLGEIAKHSRYCLVSTRVARVTPDRSVTLERIPVAYLVDADELNADPTNYWIFSQAGLTRLFHRAGWQIVDSLNVGNLADSDPVRADADERCYCLLRRNDVAAEPALSGVTARLAHGWHGRDSGGRHWRWTAGSFGLTISGEAAPRKLKLDLYVPPQLTNRLGTITLTASCGGSVLKKQSYGKPGPQSFEMPLPRLAGDPQIDFTLDKCLPPSEDDGRELGVIVSDIVLT